MTSTSFAQAQQRLAEQRAAREAASRARISAQQSASAVRNRIASHPSFLLRSIGGSALSLWDTVSSPEGTRPAFRVGQVDAELLDEELLELLRGQVGEAVRYFGSRGSSLKDEWSAEILLALRATLFKLTLWDHDATYGAALQNLRYTDARRSGTVLAPPTRWQKSLYGLFTVGGRYAWTKWENWLIDQDDGYRDPNPRVQRWSRLTSLASNAHAAAAFVSFLVFLLQGRYRTLLDRILRMRLAPPTSQVSREVSFEYLNRQLVWHAFTEFLLFVLPLVGINRWRRWITRSWAKAKKAVTSGSSDEIQEKKGEYAFLPERTCAICYQDQNTATTENEVMAAATSSGVVGSAQTDITNPYETIPCGCIYCYVCIATRLEREEGEGWTCLRCGEIVRECKPWSGDVLAPPSKSATAKTVGFADDAPDGLPELESRSDSTTRLEDGSETGAEEVEPQVGTSSPDTDSEVYEEEEDGVSGDFDEDE